MPGSIFGLDHESEPAITGGPSIGFLDSVEALWEQQYRVDSSLSREQEIRNRWDENLERLRSLTGETFQMPANSPYEDSSLGAMAAYLEYVQTGSTSYNAEALHGQSIDEILAPFKKADERIRSLNNPEIHSFADIIEEVNRMQAQVEDRTNEVWERGSTTGALIGGIGGFFSALPSRDPVSLYTLPWGGGRSVAARIASEAVINAGVAGVTDVAYVNPNRVAAGLPEHSPLFDMLTAGLGAAAFRGAGEAAYRAIPLDIRLARALNEDVRSTTFSNQRQIDVLALLKHSPRARAGIAMLEEEESFVKANPYGDTRAGEDRFIAELQDVQRSMDGLPDTAVARVLPEVTHERLEQVADYEIVRERSPEVWRRYEEAEAAVRALDEQVEVAGIEFEGRVIIENPKDLPREVLEERNPLAVERLRFEVDDTKRAAVEADYRQRLEAAETERQAKMPVGEIAAGDVRTLRKQRRAANAALRKATAAVEAERAAIRRIEALSRGRQQEDAVDLLGNAMLGRPFLGSALQHEVVERRVSAIEALAETQDDRAITGAHALTSPEGLVDIGLAKPVDENFKFIVDEAGNEMTVRQALDDLAEDEKLDEAMRTCLI